MLEHYGYPHIGDPAHSDPQPRHTNPPHTQTSAFVSGISVATPTSLLCAERKTVGIVAAAAVSLVAPVANNGDRAPPGAGHLRCSRGGN
jgi:hypothetical protein